VNPGEFGHGQRHHSAALSLSLPVVDRVKALASEHPAPTGTLLRCEFPQIFQASRRNVPAVEAKRDPEDGSTPEERAFMRAFPLKRTPPIPSGPDAEVEILGRFIGEVAKLGRYELRELSRRKSAYRALGALRASKAAKTA